MACLDFCQISSARSLFLGSYVSLRGNFCLWYPCVAGLSSLRIQHPVSQDEAVHTLSCQRRSLCSWHGCLKTWLFCSNHPDVQRLASVCSHPKGTHPPLSGKRSSDGTFLTRLTALYPQSLADAIAKIFGAAVSAGKEEIPFVHWEQLLPARLPFCVPKRRIEDGGACSSASWIVPREPDFFAGLRHAWADALRSTGLLPQILQRLGAADKAAPLSDAELQEAGLGYTRTQSGVNAWESLRLHLLRILAEMSNDPDSAFADQLSAGVSLLSWPLLSRLPLECCTSAWQSALPDLPTQKQPRAGGAPARLD